MSALVKAEMSALLPTADMCSAIADVLSLQRRRNCLLQSLVGWVKSRNILNFQKWGIEMLARSRDDGASQIQICHWGSRYAPPLHPRRRRKLPLSVLAFRLSLLRLPLGPAELGAITQMRCMITASRCASASAGGAWSSLP